MGENTGERFALSILQVCEDERPSVTAGAPQLPAGFSSDPCQSRDHQLQRELQSPELILRLWRSLARPESVGKAELESK